MLLPAPTGALSGGPDGFGYRFLDSLEPGGPAFDFQNIAGTGTLLGACDDCVQGPLPIGFSFQFYGGAYTSLYASSNGFLTFTADFNSGCCSGQAIPGGSSPSNLVAAYWEDIILTSGGTWQYQTLGSASSRVFILQWTNVPHYCCSANFVTMQIKLFETSNSIEVHYHNAPSDGGQHSAGIENAAGNVGLQYRFGSFSLASIAVRYELLTPPDPPTLALPASVYVGDDAEATFSASDPEGRDVAVLLDWGDGSPAERFPATGFVPSGTGFTAMHAFGSLGTFTVAATAANDGGAVSAPTTATIDVLSHPPEAPVVVAPLVGTTLLAVEAKAASDEPDGDPVAYLFDWGDGFITRVPAVGHSPPATQVAGEHQYAASGSYSIVVTAFDVHDVPSDPSAPAALEVLL